MGTYIDNSIICAGADMDEPSFIQQFDMGTLTRNARGKVYVYGRYVGVSVVASGTTMMVTNDGIRYNFIQFAGDNISLAVARTIYGYDNHGNPAASKRMIQNQYGWFNVIPPAKNNPIIYNREGG